MPSYCCCCPDEACTERVLLARETYQDAIARGLVLVVCQGLLPKGWKVIEKHERYRLYAMPVPATKKGGLA